MCFVYQVAYLFGDSEYFSPWYHLLGQKLVKTSNKDLLVRENY